MAPGNDAGLAGLQSERCTSCKGVFLARSREAHARPRRNGSVSRKKEKVSERLLEGSDIRTMGDRAQGLEPDRHLCQSR